MINLIIKRFIPDCDNVKNPEVRKRYGMLGGVLGILCNLLLFVTKLVVGAVSGSIAVISDAFNNLSDMGSSLVTVVGAGVSGKRADKEHPYGHGRAEYISALVVAILIIVFGLELLKSSAEKLFDYEKVEMSAVSVVILIMSILVKLWMWHYNRVMGRRINSELLTAAARDSLNDVAATSAIVASAIAARFVSFPIDGIAGICMSGLIIYTGCGLVKTTADRLMGTAPDENLIDHIEEILLSEDSVLGLHDLMVHDYGPGRMIGSVHAEVPEDMQLCEVHRVIDEAEHRIMRETGVDIVIHMDPIPYMHKELK